MAATSQTLGGRFAILELLGSGAMGNVFKATDTQTGQIVAIKQLRADAVAAEPELLERFRREAEALRQLDHPNIVKILQAFEENGQHFIALEYVGGGSLAGVLEIEPRLPVIRALHIALELADGLTRAHHLKIIHRDIKPANVLIATDGTPRLTDFGVARLSNAKSVTQTGAAVGTPHYLPPETLDGQGTDLRGDIWSFGVMMFEMLAGRRPFIGQTLTEVLTAILVQPAPELDGLRPDVPPALVDLINRMLEKDPVDRVQSVRQIGAELETILESMENSLTSAPTQTQTARAQTQRFEKRSSSTQAALHATHNLPSQSGQLIGRENEVAALHKLLAAPEHRLVTIQGIGGTGKTRLAVEAARGLVTGYANGVFYCSLATVTTADGLISAMGTSLRLPFFGTGSPVQQMLDFLRDKQALLVLDNFEQLLEHIGILQDILREAPAVQFLITSRERLNISSETVFALGGIDFPRSRAWGLVSVEDLEKYGATHLFLQCARRVSPGFTVTRDDVQEILDICRMVDGCPLAIMLAASWVEMLPVQEIAAEIAQNIGFLESTMRDLPERQRSIEAVCDYAWQRLTDAERACFQGISVFQGGFTRDASEKVARAALRDLATLTNKSMVRRNVDARYEIHELLRHYGEARLDKSADVDRIRSAHSTFYADYLSRREADLRGRRQSGGLSDVDREFENCRVAWQWAAAHGAHETIARMVMPLFLFGVMRSRRQEAADLFRAARDLLAPKVGEAPTAAYGALLAAHIAISREVDFAAMDQALTIARGNGNRANESFALLTRGTLFVQVKDYAQGIRNYEEALAAFRETGDEYFTAVTLRYLALVYAEMRQYGRMIAYNDESLALSNKIGHKIGIGLSYQTMTFTELFIGDYADAERHSHEAVEIMRETGDLWGLTLCTGAQAFVAILNGDLELAQTYGQETARVAAELGYTAYEVVGSLVQGIAATIQGNTEEGRTHLALDVTRVHPDAGAEIHWLLAVLACELNDLQTARRYLAAGMQAPNFARGPALRTWFLPIAAAVLAGGPGSSNLDSEKNRDSAAAWMSLALRHPASATGWLLKSRTFQALTTALQQRTGAWQRGQSLSLDDAEREMRECFGIVAPAGASAD